MVLALVVAAALVVLAQVWTVARLPDHRPLQAGPQEGRHYTILMKDYEFIPEQLVLRAGERVTLTLVNLSQARPGKAHEFMAGRKPVKIDTVFGARQGDGFEDPFFRDATIRLVSGRNLTMLMPGPAKLTGLEPQELVVMPRGMKGMQGMGMGGHEEGEREGEQGMAMEMKPPAGHAEEEGGHAEQEAAGHEEGGGMQMGGMGGMEMGHGHAGAEGFMPVFAPGGELTITFTVPDKPGEWTMGCFQESGQHFLNGMKGTIKVVRSAPERAHPRES